MNVNNDEQGATWNAFLSQASLVCVTVCFPYLVVRHGHVGGHWTGHIASFLKQSHTQSAAHRLTQACMLAGVSTQEKFTDKITLFFANAKRQ